MSHRFHETYWSAGGFISSHVGQNKQEVLGCHRWAFDHTHTPTHTGEEMHVTLEEPSAARGYTWLPLQGHWLRSRCWYLSSPDEMNVGATQKDNCWMWFVSLWSAYCPALTPWLFLNPLGLSHIFLWLRARECIFKGGGKSLGWSLGWTFFLSNSKQSYFFAVQCLKLQTGVKTFGAFGAIPFFFFYMRTMSSADKSAPAAAPTLISLPAATSLLSSSAVFKAFVTI